MMRVRGVVREMLSSSDLRLVIVFRAHGVDDNLRDRCHGEGEEGVLTRHAYRECCFLTHVLRSVDRGLVTQEHKAVSAEAPGLSLLVWRGGNGRHLERMRSRSEDRVRRKDDIVEW